LADRRGRPRFPWVAVILAALTIPSTFLSRGLLKLNPLLALFLGWVTVLQHGSQQSSQVSLIVSPVVPGGKGANPELQVEVAVFPTHFQGVLLLGGAA